MASITINNSFCQLNNFPVTILSDVKKALTYTDESVITQKQMLFNQIQKAKSRRNIQYLIALKQRFKDLGPETVCWLDTDNKFPTGLLHIVKDTIKSSTYKLIDERVKPEPYNLFRWNNKPPELRYYQKDSVDAFLEHGRGVLQLACGTGKTYTAVQIIKELGVNTLFIVPSTALLTQAYDIFVNCFGEKNVQKITTKDIKGKKKLKPIRVSTIQTLASLNKQGLISSPLEGLDFVIFDEAHHAASDSYVNILKAIEGIYFRLNMTATYTRNDSKLMDLWGMSGEVIYDYNAVKATEEGYLTPVEFNIVPLKGLSNRNYQVEYRDNYKSKELLESIANLINKEIPEDKQVLILIDKKEHSGDVIHEYLKSIGITNTYVTGDNTKDEIREAMEDFNDKKIRILIGSSVFGEGCDLKSTDVLIMTRGGKSEISIVQAIGRAIRLYPGKDKAIVYDFSFKYCQYLPRHLAIRIETYKAQFAGKVNWLT